MATAGTSLQMKFGTTGGVKTWTFKYAKANVSASAVTTLGQKMIENGAIFKNQPLTLESAEIVTTTVQKINV